MVSYNLKKGDRVDVIACFELNNTKTTRNIIQNSEILSIGKSTSKSDGMAFNNKDAPKTITLAVDTRESEKLAFADCFGTIRLALRRYDDDGLHRAGGIDITKLFN